MVILGTLYILGEAAINPAGITTLEIKDQVSWITI